jgi:hypothetical protein
MATVYERTVVCVGVHSWNWPRLLRATDASGLDLRPPRSGQGRSAVHSSLVSLSAAHKIW